MKDEIGYQIIEKLNILVKLNAFNLIKGKEVKEQIMVLSEVGYQPKEIAKLLRITPNNVRVRLFMIKKEKSKKSTKKVSVSPGDKKDANTNEEPIEIESNGLEG